jgi:hypothetical protein
VIVSVYSGDHFRLAVVRIMDFSIFLVSGNESYSESENSTGDAEDSVHNNEQEVGLRSLLDDDDEDDETNSERKVCTIVWSFCMKDVS